MLLAAILSATALHFAGLTSATTCVPGPIGGDRLTSYHLHWTAATGAPPGIVYRIYQARAPGVESFATPTYLTRGTKFTTPPLPSSRTYYFVVRAGREDRNRRERQGVNLCA